MRRILSVDSTIQKQQTNLNAFAIALVLSQAALLAFDALKKISEWRDRFTHSHKHIVLKHI